MIEGLPLGTRIKWVSFHFPGSGDLKTAVVKLEPDNVYGVLDLTTVKIPAGYKRAEKNWFRVPDVKETYLARACGIAVERTDSDVNVALALYDKRRIILEPIKRTREVLVTEHEIAEFPDYWNGKHQISRETAEIHVKNGSGRIEERPI